MKKVLSALTLALLLQNPVLAAYQSNAVFFGGDGHSSAVTASGTESNPRWIDATVFTVSGTWNPKSGTRVNSRGAVTISGTINVATDAAAGTPNSQGDQFVQPTTPSAGPGAGLSATDFFYGASGGGYGGAGGFGWGTAAVNNLIQSGGQPYSFQIARAGSAGGSGSKHAADGSTAPIGGKGGGGFSIYAAGPISLSGALHADGGAGSAGVNGTFGIPGSAGGSGGFLGLFSLKSITLTGPVTCAGGAGGNGSPNAVAPGGAGGGGGIVLAIAPALTLTTAPTAVGGTAGNNTGSNVNCNGQNGLIISINETPSLPLFSLLEQPGAIAKVSEFCRNQAAKNRSVSQADLIALLQ